MIIIVCVSGNCFPPYITEVFGQWNARKYKNKKNKQTKGFQIGVWKNVDMAVYHDTLLPNVISFFQLLISSIFEVKYYEYTDIGISWYYCIVTYLPMHSIVPNGQKRCFKSLVLSKILRELINSQRDDLYISRTSTKLDSWWFI